MKYLFVFVLTIFIFSCTEDPNQVYIDKVKKRVIQNNMGLKVTYRNIEFTWVDTVYEGDDIVEYHAENTYRMIVGSVNEKITARVIFDPEFNIKEIE